MKKTFKKITAMFLAIIFVFTFMPETAYAAEENGALNNYTIEILEDENNNQRSIARYFGATCPIGTMYDYTQIVSTKTRNITVAYWASMVALQTDLPGELAGHICDMYNIPGIAAEVFVYAAQNCIDAKAFEDADPSTMSIKITQYKNPTHSIGGNTYYRYVVSYYKQANCVGLITTINYYEAITALS